MDRKRVTVIRIGPVVSTKEALYFVGSMVLFFLLKPIFGGCIASPAPFSGFCRRFLYNPQLLTLHHFQKGMFAARFFSRLLHHPLQLTQQKAVVSYNKGSRRLC